MLQSGYKLACKKFENQFELDNDLIFFNSQYPFPNDLQIYKKHKSFKTIFEFNGPQLPQQYTRRLSLLNRIHYTIKLKQIKRDQIGPQTSSSHFIRFLLYYEPVPYSLSFARQNSKFVSITPAKLQKILYQTLKDLIDLNIYCQLATSFCGFTQSGQFRIFIPPSAILIGRKLYSTDKQAIMSSADKIVKFWQIQSMKPRETPDIESVSRTSYRFNSPQPKKLTIERRNNEDDSIDFKKTIKLSKNYPKEINDQKLKIGSKLSDIKKHKSLQTLQVETSTQKREKKNYQFLSKIETLNKKIDKIRMAINRRKTLQQRPQIQFFHEDSKEVNNHNLCQMKDLASWQENSQGEVIFDKQQDYNSYSLIKNNNYSVIKNNKSQTKLPIKNQQNQNQYKQSIDTYEQWMGRDYNQVNLEPNPKLRRTAHPILQKFNNIDNTPNKTILHHYSAGNRVLKRIIQKNKQICPQIFVNRENGSISKKSAGLILQMRPSFRSGEGKMKKIVSLDAFESHFETKSINLSQQSNDLSNDRKRRERELKNKEMKQKVQQVLMKSKKAIELLKNPAKNINKW